MFSKLFTAAGERREKPYRPAVEGVSHGDSARVGSNRTPTDRSTECSSRLRCFLVEDSPVIRQNLISTLEEMLPIEVVATAEDESEALHWIRRSNVDCDLMIIDIVLRSGTGLEVLRQARQLRPQVRLVVLSNYATRDIRQRCMGLGADRIFDKSAEVEELLAYGDELAKSRLN